MATKITFEEFCGRQLISNIEEHTDLLGALWTIAEKINLGIFAERRGDNRAIEQIDSYVEMHFAFINDASLCVKDIFYDIYCEFKKNAVSQMDTDNLTEDDMNEWLCGFVRNLFHF